MIDQLTAMDLVGLLPERLTPEVATVYEIYVWSQAEYTFSRTVQSVTNGWLFGKGLTRVTSITETAFTLL